MTDTTTRSVVDVRLVHVSDDVWRVERADTGKVLGQITRTAAPKTWRAAASMRAFLGDGAAGADTLADFVPRALYQPLMASEGHHHLPGWFDSQRAAVVALQTYLEGSEAPAMGYGRHPLVQRRERVS